MYGQELLGINQEKALEYRDALCRGHELLRMGYTRVNFAYFMNKVEIDYVLSAIDFVGRYGWLFLPSYTFDKETAEFYVKGEPEHERINSLDDVDYDRGFMSFRNTKAFLNTPEDIPDYWKVIEEAKKELFRAVKKIGRTDTSRDNRNVIEEEFRHLDQFLYANEVENEILNTTKRGNKIEEHLAPRSSSLITPPTDEDSKSKEDDLDEDYSDMDFFNNSSSEMDSPELIIVTPSKEILNLVGEALKDFEMIKDDDAVLVALSGGKDSLSLLHILRHLQGISKVKFKLAAVSIDPETEEYDPFPLKSYLKKLGIPYFYEVDNLAERTRDHKKKNSE
jgi:hypothetical protein